MKATETAQDTPAPSLVPLAQAAKRLGLSYSTAWQKARSGALPTVQTATKRRYVRSDVLEAMIAGTFGQGAQHGATD